jgi:MraZ protein
MDCEEELEPCFTGMYEHTLDAKGRVSLPSKVRKQLPSTVKTVLSLDKKAIYVFSPKAYRAWFDSFFPNGMNPRSTEHVKLKMRLMAFSEDSDIDSAGRLGISAKLRGIVGLDRDVTILGCDDHLEIVDRAAFAAIEGDLLDMDFMVD